MVDKLEVNAEYFDRCSQVTQDRLTNFWQGYDDKGGSLFKATFEETLKATLEAYRLLAEAIYRDLGNEGRRLLTQEFIIEMLRNVNPVIKES